MLTQEQFLEMSKNLKKAEEDDTPFIALAGDKLNVVGDANKTELNKHTYAIRFRFPKSMSQYKTEDSDEIAGFFFTELEFKDVFITPRRDLKVVGAIMKIVPFFKNLREDGELEDKSAEELIQMLCDFPNEIVDAMYDMVQSILMIDESLIDYASPASIFNVSSQLIEDYPEVFNEADVFFG